MRKILLWGMGVDYERILNQVLFEILKGNVSVEGIVCRKEDIYCEYKDGFKVIEKQEICDIEYDYIVITSSKFYEGIKKEAIELGIPKCCLIHGRVFENAYFDFAKYVLLRENPVTILSDDCWGGCVYNRLDLPFSSPLINIRWDRDEYARFIEDPIFYLNTDLKMSREGDLRKGMPPLATLGDDKRKVEMQLVHCATFDEALEQWNRRLKRINFNNIFVKMGFAFSETGGSDEKKDKYIEVFNNVRYKKVLFYYGNEYVQDAFKTERYFSLETKKEWIPWFNYNDYLRNNYFWDLDPINLLLYGKNYSRYSTNGMPVNKKIDIV